MSRWRRISQASRMPRLHHRKRTEGLVQRISRFVVGPAFSGKYGEVWRARALLAEMVRRDLRTRVSGAAMGRFWLIGRPVLFALAYFLIFGFVFEPKLPAGVGREDGKLAFAFFLLAGLVPWMAFAEALVTGAASMAGNGDLLRKTALPPILFPLQAVSVTALIYSVPLAMLLVAAMAHGLGSWKSLFLVPVWFAVQCVVMLFFAVALGLMVAAFRDVEQLVGLTVGVGLFFAPIFYAAEHAPVMLKSLIWANPYTPFANGYHALILRGEWPAILDAMLSAAWLAGSAAVAGVLYHRGRDQVVDWL